MGNSTIHLAPVAILSSLISVATAAAAWVGVVADTQTATVAPTNLESRLLGFAPLASLTSLSGDITVLQANLDSHTASTNEHGLRNLFLRMDEIAALQHPSLEALSNAVSVATATANASLPRTATNGWETGPHTAFLTSNDLPDLLTLSNAIPSLLELSNAIPSLVSLSNSLLEVTATANAALPRSSTNGWEVGPHTYFLTASSLPNLEALSNSVATALTAANASLPRTATNGWEVGPHTAFLTAENAATTYQPIGEYATPSDLLEVANDIPSLVALSNAAAASVTAVAVGGLTYYPESGLVNLGTLSASSSVPVGPFILATNGNYSVSATGGVYRFDFSNEEVFGLHFAATTNSALSSIAYTSNSVSITIRAASWPLSMEYGISDTTGSVSWANVPKEICTWDAAAFPTATCVISPWTNKHTWFRTVSTNDEVTPILDPYIFAGAPIYVGEKADRNRVIVRGDLLDTALAAQEERKEIRETALTKSMIYAVPTSTIFTNVEDGTVTTNAGMTIPTNFVQTIKYDEEDGSLFVDTLRVRSLTDTNGNAYATGGGGGGSGGVANIDSIIVTNDFTLSAPNTFGAIGVDTSLATNALTVSLTVQTNFQSLIVRSFSSIQPVVVAGPNASITLNAEGDYVVLDYWPSRGTNGWTYRRY